MTRHFEDFTFTDSVHLSTQVLPLEFVSNLNDLRRNLWTLEHYRCSVNSREQAFYNRLLRQGTCFLAWNGNDGALRFAPSRFIGYRHNSIENCKAHAGAMNARQVTVILSQLLGMVPRPNARLEFAYHRFCANADIQPRNANRPKHFWLPIPQL